MSDINSDIVSLKEQLGTHNQLTQDIKEQQAVVDALSQFVVVVDDNSAESKLNPFIYVWYVCNLSLFF